MLIFLPQFGTNVSLYKYAIRFGASMLWKARITDYLNMLYDNLSVLKIIVVL